MAEQTRNSANLDEAKQLASEQALTPSSQAFDSASKEAAPNKGDAGLAQDTPVDTSPRPVEQDTSAPLTVTTARNESTTERAAREADERQQAMIARHVEELRNCVGCYENHGGARYRIIPQASHALRTLRPYLNDYWYEQAADQLVAVVPEHMLSEWMRHSDDPMADDPVADDPVAEWRQEIMRRASPECLDSEDEQEEEWEDADRGEKAWSASMGGRVRKTDRARNQKCGKFCRKTGRKGEGL